MSKIIAEHSPHKKSDYYDNKVGNNPRYVPGDRVTMREPENKAARGVVWQVYDIEVDRKQNPSGKGYSYFYVYRLHAQGYNGKPGTTYRDVRGSEIRSVKN